MRRARAVGRIEHRVHAELGAGGLSSALGRSGGGRQTVVEVSVQVIDRGSAGCRVRICGEVDLATVAALEVALVAVVDLLAPGERLVLDAAGVGFLSACGVRVLVCVAERLRRNGGRLSIDAASAAVEQVLRVCGYPGMLGDPRGESSAGPASTSCPVGPRRVSRGLDRRGPGGGARSPQTPSPRFFRCAGRPW